MSDIDMSDDSSNSVVLEKTETAVLQSSTDTARSATEHTPRSPDAESTIKSIPTTKLQEVVDKVSLLTTGILPIEWEALTSTRDYTHHGLDDDTLEVSAGESQTTLNGCSALYLTGLRMSFVTKSWMTAAREKLTNFPEFTRREGSVARLSTAHWAFLDSQSFQQTLKAALTRMNEIEQTPRLPGATRAGLDLRKDHDTIRNHAGVSSKGENGEEITDAFLMYYERPPNHIKDVDTFTVQDTGAEVKLAIETSQVGSLVEAPYQVWTVKVNWPLQSMLKMSAEDKKSRLLAV